MVIIWWRNAVLNKVVVQSLSHIRLFATPWTAAWQTSLSFTISWSLLKLQSIESVMLSNHNILCFPFSSCPQSFPTSESFPVSGLFTSGGQNIGASSFSISLSNEYSGLISFMTDGFDLFFFQGGSQKPSLAPQFKSNKFSVLPSLWFQLSHPSWLLE